MSDPQTALFDYQALDLESRVIIQQRTGEIKTIAKRLATDIVDIGGKLAEVKDRLGGNGKFTNWLLSELGWSERTAYNFIAVHEKFGTANFAIENVAPSALYLLVAPGTPEPARAAAIQMANEGERVTHSTAKAIVESAKEAEPKTADLFAELANDDELEAPGLFDEAPALPDSEVAKCLCGHRADKHEASGKCTVDCVCEVYEEMSPEEYAEAEQREGDLKAVLEPDNTEPAKEVPVKPISKPEPAAKSKTVVEAEQTDKRYWSQQQIVIGITLMPQDKDPRGRQTIVSIRAGDGAPTIQSKRLQDLPGEWPAPIEEAITAFAAKLAAEAQSKPATKSTKKPAKKGAKK